MYKHAFAAAERGFHIFPTVARGKRPHPAVGEWGDAATTDPNTIGPFWTHVDPQANIAVACKPSGLLVVDCDMAKTDWNLRGTEWEYVHQAYGPRVDGEALLDEIAYKKGGTGSDHWDTYTVKTGSGGMHLYYRWPSTWPKGSQASIVKGVIDVRNGGGTKGGYVLAAGSVTADERQPDGSVKPGGEYIVLNDAPIAEPPLWLRLLVVEKPPPPKRPIMDRILMGTGGGSFSGLVRTVEEAEPGNRNNALLYCARAMYTDRATEQQCLDTLGPAAGRAGLGYLEIEQTIRSAYRLQRQKEG